MIVISLAVFIIALDSTFMSVALQSLIRDLNTTMSQLQLIITFYTLVMASTMLIGGKLQDIMGKKKVFLLGASLFGIGTIIAALSINSTMLFLGWSLLEGLGAALMTPATVSIIAGSYEGEKRTLALAVITAMAGIAAAIGPLFGGALTTFASWRWGFAVELLFVIIILISSSKIKYFEPFLDKKDLDKTGSVLSIIGFILLILGILQFNSLETAGNAIYLIIPGIVLLVLFVLYEKRLISKDKIPLFNVRLLKIRNFTLGSLIRLIVNVALTGSIFAVSIFLQTVTKADSFTTGLVLMSLTVGLLIFSIMSPKLSRKISHKAILIIGFIISIMGVLILGNQFNMTTGLLDIMPGMFVLGSGLGLAMPLTADIILGATDEKNESDASGFMSTSANLGSSLGTALIGCIIIMGAISGFVNAADSYYPGVVDKDNAIMYFDKLKTIDLEESQISEEVVDDVLDKTIHDAMHWGMLFLAFILFIGVILLLFLKKQAYV